MNQRGTEELRREIEQTRADLGATVEALSHRADMKARARAKAELVTSQATERAQTVQSQARQKPAVPLAVGIGAAIVALWLLRRRRS